MLKTLTYFFLDPFNLLLIGILLALLCKLLKKKTGCKIISLITLFWFLIISTSYVPNLALRHLESQHPVFNKWVHPIDSPIYIYVLGAGYTPDKNLNSSNQLSVNTLVRLAEGIRIHQFYPGSKLVFSAATKFKGYPSQAQTTANAAIELGVNPSDTLILETATNTREEASSFLQRFGNSNQVIVVSHAYHLPRVQKTFNKIGINIIPAPTGFMLKENPEAKFPVQLPNIYSIETSKIVMKEYLGAWILF